MAGSLVGIEVGSSTIKMAEITGGPGDLRAVRLAWAATPDDAYVDGVIIDPARLGQVIGDMVVQHGFTSRKAAVALSGTKNCAVRVQAFPQMTDRELKANLKLEADRLLPFPPNEDVQQDFHVLDRGDGRDTMDVLVAGVRKDHVRAWCEALRAAKLSPAAFDMEPLAQVIALVEAPAEQRRERCLMVIDVGHSAANVSIVQDGMLRFTRSVDIAGEKLTQAVHLEVKPDTMAEAEQIKVLYANVSLDLPEDDGDFMANQMLADTLTLGQKTEDEDIIISVGDLGGHTAPGVGEQTMVLDAEPIATDFFGDLGDPTAANEFALEPPTPLEPAPVATPAPAPVLEVEEEPGGVEDAGFDFIPDSTPGLADEGGFLPDGGLEDEAYTRQLIGNALVEPLANLVSEIRRSLEYYRSRHQDTAVERLVLIGGSSRIANIAAFFERELEIPVELGDPLRTVHVDEQLYPRDAQAAMAPVLAAAVGMSMRDLI